MTPSLLFWLTALLLGVMFAFGGASRENVIPVMIVELTALPAGLWAIWTRGEALRRHALVLLLLAIMLAPLAQLAPLPPEIWQGLNGREPSVEALRLAGMTPGWNPLSLAPEETFRMFLSLVPPAALLIAVICLEARERLWLVGLVLVLCVASLMLGGLQISARGASFLRLYPSTHAHLPVGFFANRNHQGILMAAALPLAAAFVSAWFKGTAARLTLRNVVYIGLVGLLIVGVLVTRSRSALALAGPALIASGLIFWMSSGGIRRREMTIVAAITATVLALVSVIGLSAVLSRFGDVAKGEGRFDTWPMVMQAGLQTQPLGAGLGAFDSQYRAIEPLALAGPAYLNHAHNDYLELWLETGVVFPAIFVLFLAWLIKASWSAWRAPMSGSAAVARAATIVILVILLHSVLDYPLRTFALAGLFALAVGLLTPPQGVRTR